jgi:hypothetical protein
MGFLTIIIEAFMLPIILYIHYEEVNTHKGELLKNFMLPWTKKPLLWLVQLILNNNIIKMEILFDFLKAKNTIKKSQGHQG